MLRKRLLRTLVSYGYYIKVPQTGWRRATEIQCFAVLKTKAWNLLSSRVGRTMLSPWSFHTSSSFWGLRVLPDLWQCHSSFCLHLHITVLPLHLGCHGIPSLIRIPVKLNKHPLQWPHFNWMTSVNTLPPNRVMFTGTKVQVFPFLWNTIPPITHNTVLV